MTFKTSTRSVGEEASVLKGHTSGRRLEILGRHKEKDGGGQVDRGTAFRVGALMGQVCAKGRARVDTAPAGSRGKW